MNAENKKRLLIPDTSKYLSKATERYSVTLSQLSKTYSSSKIPVVAQFHYLKLHRVTGEPLLNKLVSVLIDQLVQFCLKASRYSNLHEPSDHHALHREACSLLRKYIKGGEAGEILIYFLIESILNAPQLVAKMDLKTNTKAESLGSDGLHFKWNHQDEILEIYSAESKLEKKPGKAVTNLIKSLSKFHLDKTFENEFRLATAHFKHADKDMQEMVEKVLNNSLGEITYRIRHACLVGYDWEGYSNLSGKDVRDREAQFIARYEADKNRLSTLLENKFKNLNSTVSGLVIFDVFFLPFTSVQSFRTSFNEAIFRETE